MRRRLGPVSATVRAVAVAMTVALVTLMVPNTANAQTTTETPLAADAADHAVVWYDPTQRPAPHRSLPTDQPLQTMASGGGCAVTYGASSCISFRGSDKTLNGDFYVESLDHISSLGTASFYFSIGGVDVYQYSVRTSYIGHYPAVSISVGSGSGYANSIVDFYDSAGGYLMTAVSPTQWYP